MINWFLCFISLGASINIFTASLHNSFMSDVSLLILIQFRDACNPSRVITIVHLLQWTTETFATRPTSKRLNVFRSKISFWTQPSTLDLLINLLLRILLSFTISRFSGQKSAAAAATVAVKTKSSNSQHSV